VLATLPDASGAQQVTLVTGAANKPVIVSLLTKIGVGIQDAMSLRCGDRNEAEAFMTDLESLAPLDISFDTARTLLAAALHEGVGTDAWPEAARLAGLDDLAPRPIAGTAWAELLDPDGTALDMSTQDRMDAATDAMLGARVWPDRYAMVAHWLEDITCLADADETTDHHELMAYVWPAIARRSDLWTEILLRAAWVLQNGHDDWVGFAHSGLTLPQTEDPGVVPAMQMVAAQTVAAFLYDPEAARGGGDGGGDSGDSGGGGGGLDIAADGSGPPPAEGELERLLARAGAEADAEWLEGYLTACELAPEAIGPETWVTNLIAAGELAQDRQSLQRLAELVLQRYATLLDSLDDPAAVHDSVAGVSDSALAAWARGMADAVDRHPQAWRGEAMRAADRAWLDALAAFGRRDGPPPDRARLASWLIDRAELTAQPEA
jgi:yecA family protein